MGRAETSGTSHAIRASHSGKGEFMLAVIIGYVAPLVLAPFLVHGVRRLFAWFLEEGVELFLNTSVTRHESMRLGLLLARSNVVVIVLLWLVVFSMQWLDMPMLAAAAVAIVGLIIALWISIEIVRHGLNTRGWTATQIGLLAFAGGNLPFILLGVTYMAVF